MKTNRLLAPVLLALTALAAPAQTVVYREIFGNNTAAGQSIANAGWLLARGATGVLDYSTTVGQLTTNANAGNPNNIASVNSSLNPSYTLSGGAITATNNLNSNYTDTTQAGTFFVRGVTTAQKTLMFTSEYTVDRTSQEISSISFYLGNANTTDSVRVAVQISGSWYASTATFASSVAAGAATFSTLAEQKTFTWATDAASWNTLSFTAASTLSMGSALGSALPSGNVTAFGLYYDTANTGTIRFDTYTISAIPEPSTYAALAGAAALLAAGFVRHRRRRASAGLGSDS